MIVVQNPHAAVPKPPEYFNSAIGLGIMSEGRCGVGVSSFSQQFHGLREEFLGCVRVDDRGGSMDEHDSVEKRLDKRSGFTVREWDHYDVTGSSVDDA